MSELRNRMTRDLRLAGLVEGTRQLYLRAVHQLTAYYMVPPDRLSERNVEEYLLYVRDELGVAKGTFEPIVAGLKFFYLQTLGYDCRIISPSAETVGSRRSSARRIMWSKGEGTQLFFNPPQKNCVPFCVPTAENRLRNSLSEFRVTQPVKIHPA